MANLEQRKLLILDLDETLVSAGEKPIGGAEPDFFAGPFYVYRRPFLNEFLTQVAEWFDLAVWSSGSSLYVQEVVNAVFGQPNALKFVWAEAKCTRKFDIESQENIYIKNLVKVKKLGYSLEQILIIDDSREKVTQNYGNHILVSAFHGDNKDTELKDLLPFLDRIRMFTNMRNMEKRNWRKYSISTLGAPDETK